ncbi:MAG TPA: isoleucine--tRNA ligase [archaeon]|nr:isoleucine--tRNA ligase [archaeon]
MVMKQVREQYNPKQLESKIRQWWEKQKIPNKIVAQQPKKKKFYLLDGPPYVNQVPHVGHIKTTTVKDIWSKFRHMQGFNSWFQPGFDTHGLPIETMVEKELGIVTKKQIEEIGVDKFIEACKSKAEGNEQAWLALYRMLGGWRGYVEPYLTFKNYYIESAWWTTKQLWQKGMLVRGEKAIHWCPRCETALSGYEVTDSYAEVKDPSLYVKFPVRGKKNEFFVIWTTTPWTLLSNVAIAVHPDEYYLKVKIKGENETLIIAEKRADATIKEMLKKDYEVVEKFLGKELAGMRYDSVFEIPLQKKLQKQDNAHVVILSLPVMKGKAYKHERGKEKKLKGEFKEFVTMEEGTGLVHTAPGHGAEDNAVGLHYKLALVSPVDEEGRFTEETGEFKGMKTSDATKIVVDKLEKKRYLLHFGWSTHTYPLCWRCKTPLIFRLSKQWFFSIDPIKEKMIRENKKVRWLPGFGEERFHNWLENAIDWNISQQRYWGIPLPVWICESCDAMEVVGSVEELKKRAATKVPKDNELDLHKHVVDKIELECKNCGKRMKRVPDTMNVWFDSGIAPWASLGYPYHNKEIFERLWPADLVCESQDQIRGWFYSMMFCGVATFGIAPYKSVGLMGWVLDEKGEKMSKSVGNVVWADDGLKKLGADILRMYYCWEVAPWEVQNFSFKTAEEIRRSLNILWNSYAFFTTYADEKFTPRLVGLQPEDRWLISRINTVAEEVTKHLNNFEFHQAGRKLVGFVVNDVSRFYIKLIRDRVWVSEKGSSKDAALSTLHYALATVAKLLAPITPFVAEEIYQNLVVSIDRKAPESVHFADWPTASKRWIDSDLEEKVVVAQKIIDASFAARQQAQLKLRWPIRQVMVISDEKKVVIAVKELNGLLKFICNAKEVSVTSRKPEGEFSEAKFDFGSVLTDKKLDSQMMEEALLRELIREVQSLRKQNKFDVKEMISLSLSSDEKTNIVLKKFEKELKKEVGAMKIMFGKLQGKYKGEVQFENKLIEIAFS